MSLHFRHSLSFMPTCVVAALALAAPTAVLATSILPAPAPAPAPAPSSVQGPPDGMIGPSGPGQTRGLPPLVVPQPAPAQPQTRPAQPSEQPETAAPRPQPRASQNPPPGRPAPAPGVRSTDISAEPDTGPLPSAQPDPLPAIPADDVQPASAADAAPPPAESPAASPQADSGEPAEWLPLVFLGGILLLLGGAFLWRRRRTRALPAEEAIEQPVPVPARAAPPPPAAPAAPRPVPTASTAAARIGRRADLAILFEPLSAQSTLVNLRLRYVVTVRNQGDVPAAPVGLRIGLFAGAQVNPQGISQWFSVNDGAVHHAADSIAPGEEQRFEGELAAPLDALNPITIDGRVVAIPLVAVDARYGHPAGEAPIEGQNARAFVVGREPGNGSAKLAPFRLDVGPTDFSPLGQRDTGIGKVA